MKGLQDVLHSSQMMQHVFLDLEWQLLVDSIVHFIRHVCGHRGTISVDGNRESHRL